MAESLFPEVLESTDTPSVTPVVPPVDMAGRPQPRRRVVGLEARQRRQRRITYIGLFVAGVFTVNALVGENGLLASIKTSREHARLQNEVYALRADNQRLRDEARRLKNDPSAIEEAARKDLGLIRPGETLVIVKDKKN